MTESPPSQSSHTGIPHPPSRTAALTRCIVACGDAECGRCAPLAIWSLDFVSSHFSPITSPVPRPDRCRGHPSGCLPFRQAHGPELAEGRLAMSLRSIPRAKTALPCPQLGNENENTSRSQVKVYPDSLRCAPLHFCGQVFPPVENTGLPPDNAPWN